MSTKTIVYIFLALLFIVFAIIVHKRNEQRKNKIVQQKGITAVHEFTGEPSTTGK